MQISIPVTFDATNQTMSVSDSSLITFPQNTSDFSIVTVNGMDCITPTTVALSNGYVQPEHYIQFTVSDTVEEVEFDSYADITGAPNAINLWIEFYSDSRAHQYSLVYDSGNAKWLSPDNAYANLPTQQWYSIKVINNDSIKIYDKSTGTLVHSRSLTGKLSYINLGKFYANTNFYLANLVLKRTINTDLIRYANTSGIAEIWANIKNWVAAHIGNGTLTIQKNGTDVTTFSANSSSNATANITVPTKVSDLTNDSGFLTTANIPSKTSDLTNDSGFLTSHQSLANYVTLDGAETISGNKTFTGTLTGDITGNCSGSSGSCTGNAATATQFSANKAVTLTGDITGTASSKAGWSVATTLSDSGVTAGTYGPSADVTGNNNATISVPEITVDSKGRVTSVANRTLTCKNNTYSVHNKTLTIQKNGTNVATFTSNSNTDVTANITVPTKVSELDNDSGFLTSHQSLSNYVTLNGKQTLTATKTFTTNINTASIATSQRETWRLVFNKDSADTDSTTAAQIGVFQGANSHNFSAVLRLANPRANNKPTTGNTSNCWSGIGVYYNYDENKGYPYALYCWDWPTSSNSTNELASTSWVRTYCETTKGFLTSHQSLSNYSTLANTVKSLSISGKTITVTPGSGSAYTLTTQDTVYTHPTTSGNKHIPSGGSSGQFLGWDSDGTAKWVNNPNTNTDTLMTQNVSTTNATYPVLLVATADATANQGAKTGIFAKSVKVNPSTNVISASGFSGPLTGNVTGNCSGSSGSCTGNAATASKVVATVAKDNTGALVQGTMGANDCFRIAIGGASNAGWAEIATGDDYNEPIYVRQYQGSFATLKRTATLLDASGNTSFPGTVTATGFSGPLTGNVTGNCSGSSGSCTGLAAKATKNANGKEITNSVIKGLSISGKTITYTQIDGSTGTLTTQDTVYTHPTTAGNKHIPSGGSSGQILKYSSSGTAVWADVSFTRQMVSIATDSFDNALLNRTKTVTLTKSQLAVVTVDLTTESSCFVKLTASNIFVVALHTLVGNNVYRQDSVNYGCILQQGASGRTRVVALIFPYNTSVEFTLAKVSGSVNPFSSYSLTVYQ